MRLLSSREVADRLGVSRSTLIRLWRGEPTYRAKNGDLRPIEPDPTFPQPARIGALLRWRETDISTWQEAQFEAQAVAT